MLLLAPELYGPLRRAGVEYHAAADARATLQRLLEVTGARTRYRAGTPAARSPTRARRRSCSSGHGLRARRRSPAARRPVAGDRAGRGDARSSGRAAPASRPCCASCSGCSRSRDGVVRCGGSSSPPWTSTRGARRRRGCRSGRCCCRPRSPTISASPTPMPTTSGCGRRSLPPASTSGRPRCPGGLAARAGEGGVAASAGERRRLALARIALRVPALVLVDEPTANLDAVTASLVRDALERIVAGRTAVLVTHDPEVAALAARTVMLAAGREADGGARVTGVGTLRGWWSGATGASGAALAPAVALATAAALATPALLGLSGYLLARAAEQPEILTLAVAIVGVRFFGLLRAAARYAERLVVHDLALSRLGRVRVAVFAALIPRVPGRLGGRTSAGRARRRGVRRRPARRPARPRARARGSSLLAAARVRRGRGPRPARGGRAARARPRRPGALPRGARRARRSPPRGAALGSARRALTRARDAARRGAGAGRLGRGRRRAPRVSSAPGRRVDRLAAAAARVASAAGATTILAAGAGALAMLAVTVPRPSDGVSTA